ncbi:hypothetical protein M378DRAFT_75913 [Amanita muscaria Koide BX008]|uniref:Uncharacterized protein n=1 Tax=Amanita muscaria (strain Koide BX008) TaxID=946122 RepID=A0A0C2SRT7_AMAMK|nr:hypothetical protein M378DRAFT_75913 [Amanita muscaria Koide BX008]
MLTKANFKKGSEVGTHYALQSRTGNENEPFGGRDIILTGDFHQFPPVGNKQSALYCPTSPHDSKDSILGKTIFDSFDTVVILHQQNRIQDEEWSILLQRLRTGECTEKDVEEAHKLVLGHPDCPKTDFTRAPWKNAILVTPRHSVRHAWNEACLDRHCRLSGQRQYRAPAYDTLRTRTGEASIPMSVKLAIAELNERSTGRLPDHIDLAIGMKAMVVLNLSTEKEIANGTRGIVEDLILDPNEDDEPTIDDDGTVLLKFPPLATIFRPEGGCDFKFNTQANDINVKIPTGCVPIAPSTTTFTVNVGEKSFGIRRRQLAMTAGYAFTDYKSQGQTIEYAIIDLAKPPRGTITPFSAYVALSRSRSRNTVRLLRDISDDVVNDVFMKHPSLDLKNAMEHLERLNNLTKEQVDKGEL